MPLLGLIVMWFMDLFPKKIVLLSIVSAANKLLWD